MPLTYPPLPLRMARLQFILRPEARISLPILARGDVLRGALGTNLKPEHCPPKCPDPHKCSSSPGCPYAKLFSPSVGGKSIPGPFVLRPSLSDNLEFGPSRPLQFELRLFGLAIHSAHHFIQAFQRTHRSGLADVPAQLVTVDSLDWEGMPRTALFAEGRLTGNQPSILTFERFFEQSGPAEAVLDFVTPTELVHDGRTVQVPTCVAVAQRTRGRLSNLCESWENQPWDMAFELETRAAEASIADWHGTWPKHFRQSRQNGHRMALTGFQGTVAYKGIPAELWPLLRIGQEVHIGTHTAWGLGWFRHRC